MRIIYARRVFLVPACFALGFHEGGQAGVPTSSKTLVFVLDDCCSNSPDLVRWGKNMATSPRVTCRGEGEGRIWKMGEQEWVW